MNNMWRAILPVLCVALVPAHASSQSLDVMGTRAAGMGGAFVAVADDASAVYWNPAGLAAGSYFSLVLDGGERRAVPDGPAGLKQSSFLIAATMPALGLSYYRIRTSSAVPEALLQPVGGSQGNPVFTAPSQVRVDTLVTNHAGITLVQSIVPSVAIGSTLKLVRGIASTRLEDAESAEDALDAGEPQGRGSTRIDLDVGVMATGRRVKAGLTVRNLREPEFTSPEGRTLKLERQARAGVSYALLAGLTVAGDLDLTTVTDSFGERRDAAAGFEARLARRAWLRSGVRFNTASEDGDSGGSRRALTFGGSYAATASVMVDAVVISGGDLAGRGWGLSARFVY